jgi:spectinomycin phosphotransferase/16S rRNA (guanine(1405)-N(7))-methyltransferase
MLWGFRVASVEYRPVGFGSHHWLATDTTGQRLFATVDDLTAKLWTARDTADAAFGRLEAAYASARALRDQAGLHFVIAAEPMASGQIVARLSARYSLVVLPFVAGAPAGEDGEFANDADRRAVVEMIIQVHGARVGAPCADEFVVPKLDALRALMGQTTTSWRGGPYAGSAQDLLRTHARDLATLIRAYHRLAERVAARPGRLVITHGEPHAANVIATSGGLVLVDWDTTLLAPPERDLWDLAEHDPSVLRRYTEATGTRIDDDALTLYRLWFDLAEIASYLSLFYSDHEDTEDARESWANLKEFLRPAERWPGLTEAQT